MATPQRPPYRLVLGSSSRWRRQVLSRTGLPFAVAVADIDEAAVTAPGGALADRARSDPTQLSQAIARAKADALLPRVNSEPTLLVTADQVVAYRGTIREKPTSREQCREFLKSYADEPAVTVSSLVVTNTATGRQAVGTDIAKQHFLPLPEHVIDQLVADPLMMSTAGAFRIESEVMKPYLGPREGDESSILGLPLPLLFRLLDEVLDGMPLAEAIGGPVPASC